MWEECLKKMRALSVSPEQRMWYKGRHYKTESAGIPLLVMEAEDHIMVTPNDLKWADVPSLPPGAVAAVPGIIAIILSTA